MQNKALHSDAVNRAREGRRWIHEIKMMWKITILCNTLLMCVFGLASAASQIKLRNAFVRYPNTTKGWELPCISDLALKLHWTYSAIPWAWVALGVLVIILNWKKTEPPRDVIQLHTSATLLIGFFMVAFFTVAGVMPFIPLVVGMSP